MELLKDYAKIVVETDEENPTIIAVITSENIEAADGYRVRLVPMFNKNELRHCAYCENLILKTDKYCQYCGKPTKIKSSLGKEVKR